MKIALVIYGTLDTLSGGYLYDRKLVEALQRAGHTLEVVSLPWRDYARHLSDNASPRLAQRLLDGGYDLIIQDELNHPSLLNTNRRLRQAGGPPIVTIVHHLRSSEDRFGWQNALYRLVERPYLRSVDGYVFNSRTTLESVKSAGVNVEARPWVIAYPGGNQLTPQVSDDEIIARSRTPGPLRLLFVGNVIPRKGLHVLLKAVERLPSKTVRLDVVGNLKADPHYTAAIRRRIALSPGLQSSVRLIGRLSDSNLRARMLQAQVLIVPSSYEGFGIAYLEGMGCGLPAIGTTAGAAHEIITHGVDGFLAPPNNAAALTDCLALLAHDRSRLVQMSQAARQRYLAHPTWEQSGALVAEFLAQFAHRTV